VGVHTFDLVQRFVDEIATVPDDVIFENVAWVMTRCKLVAEGAAAATVAALRSGAIAAEPGTKVVCVLSGGNLDVSQLAGLRWN
jgi:threonine dehydratase